jgi:hypothetical protein
MMAEAQETCGESHSPRAYLGRLEGLAELITAQGLQARLVAPPGRVPSLHVVNPAASALAEDVYAGPCQDGRWWFWWSWAERIAADDDLAEAATRIGRVLAARD